MSKANMLQKTLLKRTVSKHLAESYADVFTRQINESKLNIVALNEAVSKESVIEILDQILEYSTRSKKDLDTDNTEMLRVDIKQIITFCDQLKSLVDEAGADDTGGDTGTEDAGTEATGGEATDNPDAG